MDLNKLSEDVYYIIHFTVPPRILASLIKLVDNGTISGTTAKKVFSELWDNWSRVRTNIIQKLHENLVCASAE